MSDTSATAEVSGFMGRFGTERRAKGKLPFLCGAGSPRLGRGPFHPSVFPALTHTDVAKPTALIVSRV
ncbi:MAG: hypothetical protein CW342_09470 [Thermoactinomycetaceae bacterium]|nr:hypothetical protein [Thermoactinomycetaceae bacterium]